MKFQKTKAGFTVGGLTINIDDTPTDPRSENSFGWMIFKGGF